MTEPAHPASDGLFAIAGQIAGLASGRGPGEGPLVIGVTGAVASGKSTFAAQMRETLTSSLNPPWVEIVCTDGFLMPNARLEELGLMDQKGFPPYLGDAVKDTVEVAPSTTPTSNRSPH